MGLEVDAPHLWMAARPPGLSGSDSGRSWELGCVWMRPLTCRSLAGAVLWVLGSAFPSANGETLTSQGPLGGLQEGECRP